MARAQEPPKEVRAEITDTEGGDKGLMTIGVPMGVRGLAPEEGLQDVM